MSDFKSSSTNNAIQAINKLELSARSAFTALTELSLKARELAAATATTNKKNN